MKETPLFLDLGAHSNDVILGSHQANSLLTDTRMHALYCYWLCKRGLHLAPARQDIDPLLDVPKLAPFLFMIRRMEKEEEKSPQPEFKLTVVGTQLVHIVGRDNTGRLIGPAQNHVVLDRFAPILSDMLANPRPHFGQGPASWVNQDYASFQHLLLPLCDRQGRLTHIMGSLLFQGKRKCRP